MKLDINGTTIEAETLKELNKLAKKEEKRQAEATRVDEERYDKAYDKAYETLGRIVMAGKTLTCTDPKYYVTEDETGYQTVKIEQRQQSASRVLSYNDRVLTVLTNSAGHVFAILVQYKQETPEWAVLGAYEGKGAFLDMPDSLAATLTSQYEGQQERQAA